MTANDSDIHQLRGRRLGDSRSLDLPVVLALDVGTSSTRATIYDVAGRPVPGLEVREEEVIAPQSDANEVVESVSRAVDEVLRLAGGLASEIAAVGLDTLASSVVGVDGEGRTCTPLSTYADGASVEVAAELRRELDAEAVRRRTGCAIHPSYLPARIRHFQQIGAAAGVDRWLDLGTLLLETWLGRRLGTSYSMASWSGLLDRRANHWDAGLLAHLGLSEGALPRLCDELDVHTGLAEEYARRWPALREAPFCPAIGDGAAANVGSGCVGGGRVALTVGTSGALRMLFEHTPDVEAPRGLWAYRLGADDTLLGASFGEGGNVGDWAREVLQVEAVDMLEEKVGKRAPASHGLTVLPFIAGERSTGWSLDAQAAIVGFRPETTAAEVYQAMIEATTYRYAEGWRLLRPFADDDVRIIASGGGLAASAYWAQLVADVFGRPVTMFEGGEASSRGSAIMALRAIGAWRGLIDVRPDFGPTYEPRVEHAAVHAEAIERQERLYGRLIDRQL